MPWIALRRSLFVCLISVLLFAGLSGEARAEGPEMVEDIGTGSRYLAGPRQFFSFRGKLLFFANDTDYGPALWSSDGTSQGTSLLGVLCPSCGEPQLMGATSTVAFYAVYLDNGEPGRLLTIWRTDGTPAGTYPVTGTLRAPVHPQGFRSVVGVGRAYFTACTPEQGCEIWSSDGTPEGTGPVTDRVPGPGSFVAYEMVALGEQAYVLGRGIGSTGLWRVDAASRAITRVRPLRAEPRPRLLTVLGERLFFVAQADGLELWSSDGTAAGTSVVSGYTAADPFLATHFLEPIDGRLYFLADDGLRGIELWGADGTGGGLRAVTDFRPYFPFGVGEAYDRFTPESLERVGGRLLFAADDGRTGFRLWTSSGRLGSTQRLTGCPGGCPEVRSLFARLGTRVVFAGVDAKHGMEPWISDGTGPGTRILRDIVPGPGGTAVRAFTGAGNRVFFQRYIEEREPVEIWATDGTQTGTVFLTMGGAAESHYLPPPTRMELGALGPWTFFGHYDWDEEVPQLWRSDGTAAGTDPLFEWHRESGSVSGKLNAVGDDVLFTPCRGSQNELWVSGGTAATTDKIDVELGPCGHPVLSGVVDLGEVEVFRLSREYVEGGGDGTRAQIWRTDGTKAGTVPLASFQNLYPGTPVPVGNKALFPVTDLAPGAPLGISLWVTDGTAAGTMKQVDLPPGVSVFSETGAGSEAFFVGITYTTEEARIWRTDGTAAGTFPITGVVSNLRPGVVTPQFTRLGDRVYFLVLRPAGGVEIWSTDGTPTGTGPAVTAAHGMEEPDSLWAAGGLLFFRARETGGSRPVLWRTDGTPAGTFPLGANLSDSVLTPLSNSQDPSGRFATLGDEVFFQATDGVHGAELWKSDGTREGTVLVKDIFPGIGGSHPLWPVAAGDRIYFSASDGPNGRELWTSDGTAPGTHRVADIAPGPSWSDPQWLAVAGDQLFFSADDGVHGRELWRSPL